MERYSNSFIDEECVIEEGVEILPNCFIKGKSYIGKGTTIGPNTEIDNSIIGKECRIKQSTIADSSIKDNVSIGPFAHIRNESIIESGVRIGNFVEIKKSWIGENSKIAHLTYLGDLKCGKNVNFGCGVVSVNYDGKYKNKTIIGDNVFIGCNANLIAPLTIGDDAYIAAGSTITNDINKKGFSIARCRQINKENYAIKYNYYKKNHSEDK